MIRFSGAFAALCFVFHSWSQTNTTTTQVSDTNFVFSSTGHIDTTKIPSLIPYRKKNKWGFCNRQMKMVIDTIYDETRPFNKHGLAVVGKNTGEIYPERLYGLINTKGKIVLPIKYKDVNDFNSGGASLTGMYAGIEYCDSTGKLITSTPYHWNPNVYFRFREGRGVVERNRLFGFIDLKGKEVIPLIYKSFTPFSGNRAFVEDSLKHCFMIDRNGKIIAKLQDSSWYKPYGGFVNGVSVVTKNDRYGVMDTNGKFIVKPDNYLMSSFNMGVAVLNNDGVPLIHKSVKQKDSEFFCYIDEKGTVLTGDKKFDLLSEWQGIGIAYKDKKFMIVDKNGNVIKDISDYIPLDLPRETHNMDRDWDSYRNALNFTVSDGLFKVRNKKTEKWGYMDMKGNLVIACVYKYANDFYKGTADVYAKGNHGLINTKGEYIVPPIYEDIDQDEDALIIVREKFNQTIGDQYDKSIYGYVDRFGRKYFEN